MKRKHFSKEECKGYFLKHYRIHEENKKEKVISYKTKQNKKGEHSNKETTYAIVTKWKAEENQGKKYSIKISIEKIDSKNKDLYEWDTGKTRGKHV